MHLNERHTEILKTENYLAHNMTTGQVKKIYNSTAYRDYLYNPAIQW